MTTTTPRMKPIRNKLATAAAACALLTTAGLASAGAASASAAPPRARSAALRAALHRDLSRYRTARRTAEQSGMRDYGACRAGRGAVAC